MVVLCCLPFVVLPLLSFSAAVQDEMYMWMRQFRGKKRTGTDEQWERLSPLASPKHYHSIGLVSKYVDNILGKHLSPSALFKRSPRVSALAVNTTAKERVAKRFLHVPPEHADFHNKTTVGVLAMDKTDITPDDSNPIEYIDSPTEAIDGVLVTDKTDITEDDYDPVEYIDSPTEAIDGVLVTDKTDITPDDSNASIPSTVSGSDVEEGQSTHKMTAEVPPGSPNGTAVPTPNGTVMPTSKETTMIEETSLSAFTSSTEGTVNHDNARYSDNVLLPADDTPEALTKSSLSLKLNKCNNRNLTGFRVCSSLFARLTGIHPKERLCLIGKSKEA